MADKMIYLASNSPRRKEIVSWSCWPYRLLPVEIDESPLSGEAPSDYVLRLAESKARAASQLLSSSDQTAIILSADTTVADRFGLLGKPADAEEAETMLHRLYGQKHQVLTALALFQPADNRLVQELCVSEISMRRYSDDELKAYVATGDPLDKAGAYAIQNPQFHPVENFKGCMAGVVGLPLCHLTRALSKLNVTPSCDPPKVCQEGLNYSCPIFTRVLAGENLG
jgi:septum formation protein